MIFWLTSSRHSTKLSIAYSYFTSYNLMRKDPLSAGLFLSMHAAVPSFNDGKNARDLINRHKKNSLFGLQFI